MDAKRRQAVRMYAPAREGAEAEYRVHVDRALGDEVAVGLRRSGYELTAER